MRRAWMVVLLPAVLGIVAPLLLAGKASAKNVKLSLTEPRLLLDDSLAGEIDFDPVTDDPSTMRCLYCLFVRARGDIGDSERAAWIVSENGVRRCEVWPFNATDRTASPGGLPPHNAFEAVHTHPNNTDFSPQDYQFARVSGRSLYLIHRNGIWKYDPQTDKVTKKKDSRWRDAFREGRCECGDIFESPEPPAPAAWPPAREGPPAARAAAAA